MRPLDQEARRAVLSMLAEGTIRPHEAAKLAGVSLQVVDYWIRKANVDWEQIRDGRIGNMFRKKLNNGSRLVERKKPPAG